MPKDKRELGRIGLPKNASTLARMLEVFAEGEPNAEARVYNGAVIVEAPWPKLEAQDQTTDAAVL